jgi:2-methylcitrate dehydratase PrpD
VFFKPYPANHFTHAAADAIMALRREGLSAVDVQHIRVGVATPTVRTIGQPIEAKRRPRTGYQAQFSGPYVVAAALLGGGGLGLSLDDFRDQLVDDPERLDLMDKIDIEGDARCDAIYPYQFPAVVDVTTTSGASLTSAVLANRGGPQNPLTRDELAAKFHSNAARRLDPREIDAVQMMCDQLDDVTDVGDIVRMINRGVTSG